MADMTRGLGRGLDALLGGSASTKTVNPAEVTAIKLSRIEPNRHQPRMEFSQEALEDLTASIKAQGVLQPILVRPREDGSYELVAGERRLRASKLAGLDEIPALIRDMTDEQSLAIALIENLQREDLNAIEEARGYKRLQDEFGLSQQELGNQVGKSRSAVANSLRLLNLAGPIQESISDGQLSAGHGRALMSLEDESARTELFERITGLGLSVRQAEAETIYHKRNGHFPESGATSAPKRSTGSTRKPAETDSRLKSISQTLEERFGVSVRTSGTSVRGKIAFHFSNEEEFDQLIEQLGVNE